MSTTDEGPIRMRAKCEYWGRLRGTGAMAHDEHSGPHGRQLRFYPGRALRRKLGKHGLSRMEERR